MPSSKAAAGTQPSVNPDLKAVHTELVELSRQLDEAVGRAQTSAQVIAILDELVEVNARVTSVGRQLFTQQTDKIRKNSETVVAAAADARRAIAELDRIKDLIQSITKFLGLVDKLVDLSKLVV